MSHPATSVQDVIAVALFVVFAILGVSEYLDVLPRSFRRTLEAVYAVCFVAVAVVAPERLVAEALRAGEAAAKPIVDAILHGLRAGFPSSPPPTTTP